MRGWPSTSASTLAPKVVCIEVNLKSWLSTLRWRASRRSSITTRMPWRSDSSRTSVMPSIFLSRASSLIFLIRSALLT